MEEIRFTLNGVVFDLSREQVIAAVKDEQPQPIQKLAVRAVDRWFPVKQVLGRAIGLDNNQFNSTRAHDLLRRLDFELHSIEDDGPLPARSQTGRARLASRTDHLAVLGLAVELHAGRSEVDGATAIRTADEFLAWLDGMPQ